jgi:hypothetical protein
MSLMRNPPGRKRHQNLPPEQDGKMRKRIVELASMGCTNEEICCDLTIGSNTLYKHYETDLKKGRANLKCSLRRKQYQMAMAGNVTMLIWLGKQFLGQRDKQDVVSETTTNIAEQAPNIVIEVVEAIAPQLRDDYNSSAERKSLAPIVLIPTGTDSIE